MREPCMAINGDRRATEVNAANEVFTRMISWFILGFVGRIIGRSVASGRGADRGDVATATPHHDQGNQADHRNTDTDNTDKKVLLVVGGAAAFAGEQSAIVAGRSACIFGT